MRNRGGRRRAGIVAVVTLLGALLAACSGDDGATPSSTSSSRGSVAKDDTGPKLSLVALGDSYSSGDGATSAGEAGNSTDECPRAEAAWADQLDDLTSVSLETEILACPGATRDALSTSFAGQEPQLEGLEDADDPDIVTITIGGNDVGFVPGLTACYVEDCVADGFLGAVAQRIDQAGSVLAGDYAELKKAAPDATVAVIGYPDLFGEAAPVGCPWLTTQEQAGVREIQERLDAQMAAAADTAGVEYVSTSGALDGHEMCTSDPWLNPVQNGEGTPAHPNTDGQLAMAKTIQAAMATVLPA